MSARRNPRQAAKADQATSIDDRLDLADPAKPVVEPEPEPPKGKTSRQANRGGGGSSRNAGSNAGRRGGNRGNRGAGGGTGNSTAGGAESAPRRARRRTSLAAIFLTAITVVFGLLTLLGLAPVPGLDDATTQVMSDLSTILIQLVTVVGAFALILGVLNLLAVHVNKFSSSARGGLYSLVTLLTTIVVVVVHLVDRAGLFKALEPGRTPGDSPLVSLTLMDTLQVTLEAALAGLMAFFLVYAAYRLLRRRLTGWNILFLVTLIAVLIGYIPLANLDALRVIRDWLLRVPVSAGTRGILIGVALGTIITGVRLLLGQDRSFRE